MLKRTKGRLLITLLVITGLAGTLKHTSLTLQERKFAMNLMKDSKTEVLNSTRGLSPAQLNFKLSEGWSVFRHVDRIASSENDLWQLLETTMKKPANPEDRTEIPFSNDEEVIAAVMNHSSIIVKNSSSHKFKNVQEALEDFKNKRTAHIKYLRSSTEDLRNHVVQTAFGWVDCYQLCLAITASTQFHLRQIAELKASPNFPH